MLIQSVIAETRLREPEALTWAYCEALSMSCAAMTKSLQCKKLGAIDMLLASRHTIGPLMSNTALLTTILHASTTAATLAWGPEVSAHGLA